METTVDITRTRLDSYFAKIRKIIVPRPKDGWIKEVRKALLMNTAQLAKRLGISQSNVSAFEKSERNKKITLHSLERVAEALDCELHYLFIPKSSLGEILSARAKKLLKNDDKSLEHHMRLEGQGTNKDRRQAIRLALMILNKDKRLWEDLD